MESGSRHRLGNSHLVRLRLGDLGICLAIKINYVALPAFLLRDASVRSRFRASGNKRRGFGPLEVLKQPRLAVWFAVSTSIWRIQKLRHVRKAHRREARRLATSVFLLRSRCPALPTDPTQLLELAGDARPAHCGE
jgi:hypothetical protein